MKISVSGNLAGYCCAFLQPSKFLTSCSLLTACLLVACTSLPPVTTREHLPSNSEVAVVMFRDCMIRGQEDCDGSGLTAGSIFARVLSQKSQLRAVPVSRPVDPKDPLSDDAVVVFAKAKGYPYVLNGEVEDYYRVAPFTFRVERAGVSVRLLRTSDGQVMSFFSDRMNSKSNLTTPDALLEDMAEFVGQGIK